LLEERGCKKRDKTDCCWPYSTEDNRITKAKRRVDLKREGYLGVYWITSITLYPTIRKKVNTIGRMARFSMVDRRLFHSLEADRISDALSRAIKHTTETTLISETPTTENMLTTDDVVLNVLVALKVLVVLNVLLTVLNMDDNNGFPSNNLSSQLISLISLATYK